MSGPAGWYPDPGDPRVQRFWDGYGWAGQRFWDGSRWVDRQPAPNPQPSNRTWWWLGGGVLAAAAVTVVVVAAVGDSSSPSGGAGLGAGVPTAAVHASAGSAQAMRAWERTKDAANRTPVQVIAAVEKDVGTIGRDYASHADETTLLSDCDKLKYDDNVPTDSPNRTVNGNFKKASEYFVSGSVDCGADDQAAAGELNKGIDYLNAAISEIKSLGG